jgi:hypothetical protein
MHEPPMRNEDDLRAVLADLERYAPDMDAVLGRVRARTGTRHRPGWPRILARQAPQSPRWPRLVTGLAAVAALAGLVIALVPGVPAGHGPVAASRPAPTPRGLTQPGPPPAGSQYGLPSAASTGRAMLTAAGGLNDDILYTTETGINPRGVVMQNFRYWSWPALPVTGQPADFHEADATRTSANAPLLETEEYEFSYIVPAGSANYVKGHLTLACYPAPENRSGCGYGNASTPPGTYATWDRRFVNPNPGLDDLSPRALAREVAQGQWRVTRRARLGGQMAIELTQTPKGIYGPLPTTLWISARSHLPLRMFSNGSVVSWSFLKPTPANMALLKPQIPAGYPRSAGS